MAGTCAGAGWPGDCPGSPVPTHWLLFLHLEMLRKVWGQELRAH